MSSLKDLPNIDTVRHDTVDVTRQVLQYLHFEAQHALVTVRLALQTNPSTFIPTYAFICFIYVRLSITWIMKQQAMPG